MTKKSPYASIEKQLIVPETLSGQRLDHVMAQLCPDFSRARIQQFIEKSEVTVDHKLLKRKHKVYTDQVIELSAKLAPAIEWQAQDMPLDLVFEDEHLLVINKPAGLVVHPASGNPDNTLVNALLHHCHELEQLPRAGLVHRLDKDTTGLLVVAKTLSCHHKLVKLLELREMTREYRAIAHGQFISGGTLNAPIARHPRNRVQMAVVPSGKSAVTHYRILKKFQHFTYLSIKLETGRTHQIRVHFAHTRHPLVGDPVYGGRNRIPKGGHEILNETLQAFNRQALHAFRLTFNHPETNEVITQEAPLPEDFQILLNTIEKWDGIHT